MASPRAVLGRPPKASAEARPGERRRRWVIENFTWLPLELRGYNLFSYLLPQ